MTLDMLAADWRLSAYDDDGSDDDLTLPDDHDLDCAMAEAFADDAAMTDRCLPHIHFADDPVEFLDLMPEIQ